MTRYDVIIWDKVPKKGSEEKQTIARRVGNAKTENDGKITMFIADGISISGRVTLSPWKEQDDTAQE